MDSRPDRVQIWASQLAANDFPPVCAMTGRPAETWRKFRFATPPDWAYALLALVVLRRWIGPGAKVMEPPIGYYDKPVELRRVHPIFVGAIHQMQATRMAQIARPT